MYSCSTCAAPSQEKPCEALLVGYSVLVTIDDRGSQPFSLLRLVYGIQRADLNENALTNFDIVLH